jgi:hypothetical protein
LHQKVAVHPMQEECPSRQLRSLLVCSRWQKFPPSKRFAAAAAVLCQCGCRAGRGHAVTVVKASLSSDAAASMKRAEGEEKGEGEKLPQGRCRPACRAAVRSGPARVAPRRRDGDTMFVRGGKVCTGGAFSWRTRNQGCAVGASIELVP